MMRTYCDADIPISCALLRWICVKILLFGLLALGRFRRWIEMVNLPSECPIQRALAGHGLGAAAKG